MSESLEVGAKAIRRGFGKGDSHADGGGRLRCDDARESGQSRRSSTFSGSTPSETPLKSAESADQFGSQPVRELSQSAHGLSQSAREPSRSKNHVSTDLWDAAAHSKQQMALAQEEDLASPESLPASSARKRTSTFGALFDFGIYFLTGVVLGGFAGAIAVIAHASPLDFPWIGLILAAALTSTGGWFSAEFFGKCGVGGFFLGSVAVTLMLMFSLITDDVVAIQTELTSRIWVIVQPIFAFVPTATAFKKKSG